MDERLRKVENAVTELVTESRLHRERVGELVEKHDHFINGNGQDGAKVRLNSLEQSRKWKDRMSLAALFSLIGLAIKHLWQLMTNHQ